ncbi:MAG: cation:proton antiporter [Pseudanabaenaceae cyanobacterium SKYGB_i_bin29]|nr:cation:proton antiporter [Pseudanabaenaceae cyanobacterium SKYG29]MDW8421792.1 cation:proton antiporter [Pseudanabaenaceae cyanobacterium SKYGB_i_bin29]
MNYLNLLLRLLIWFLLTADLSIANIIIGLVIVLVLPNRRGRATVGEWLLAIWNIIVSIPRAYFEAIEMIIFPHQQEQVTLERVRVNRIPALIFLEIFVITFTPKTIVLNYREDGYYEVHRVKRQ